MKKWLLAIVFGSALVLGACGNSDDSDSEKGNDTNSEESAEPATPSSDNVDSAEAEATFKKNCASCHAQDLSGGAGPNLQKVGSNLSEDEIKTTIENGKGSMPGFKSKLSEDDIGTLSAWLAEHK